MRTTTWHLDVELITPAMIGGHDQRECDQPPTLRGPSLRGVLRFWSRALAGDALAEELFGTVDTGPRVRVRSFDPLPAPQQSWLLDDSTSPMTPPGGRARIWFDVPDSVSEDRLRAVVWTWLHLGGIGRRSRRGYGSPRWRPRQGDLLEGFAAVAAADDAERFEEALRDGLERAAGALGVALEERRANQEDFRLASPDQVFVGRTVLQGEWPLVDDGMPYRDSIAETVHGYGGESLQTGATGNPSPMLWRLHRTEDGYRVVMTWSPRGFKREDYPQVDRDSGLYKYLHDGLGLGPSLAVDGGELGRA